MDNQCFIPQVHFELIPIRDLVSNQCYQRPISAAHIGRTAENFNLYQINPVKVSRREGVNYVFDGQHTIETVASASGSRDTPVWCMVYDDLSYEMEADIFANQKKYTRPLKSIEIFNANIEAENELQLTIKQIVETYGLKISAKRIPGNISAVNALEYIFNKYGYKALDRTLFLVVSAWEGEVDSLTSNMLKGVGKLVMAYGESLNDEQFIERLGKVSVREIIRTAKDRHAGTQGFSEAILLQYNKRLKYPLKWEKIKNAKAEDTDEEEAVDDSEFADEYDDEPGIPDTEDALPDEMLMDPIVTEEASKSNSKEQ